MSLLVSSIIFQRSAAKEKKDRKKLEAREGDWNKPEDDLPPAGSEPAELVRQRPASGHRDDDDDHGDRFFGNRAFSIRPEDGLQGGLPRACRDPGRRARSAGKRTGPRASAGFAPGTVAE